MSTEFLIPQRRPRYIAQTFYSLQAARLDAVERFRMHWTQLLIKQHSVFGPS